MNTAARVVSLVQEGIRNFERPLFVDQLGMQGRQHFTDTDSMKQDGVPPPFSDRPGMHEGKQERQVLHDSTSRTLQPELSPPFDAVPPPFVEHDRLGM